MLNGKRLIPPSCVDEGPPLMGDGCERAGWAGTGFGPGGPPRRTVRPKMRRMPWQVTGSRRADTIRSGHHRKLPVLQDAGGTYPLRSATRCCSRSNPSNVPPPIPKGAVLFVEGQSPRGIFVLCKGRVRLSICSTEGKTLILQVSEPGEVLGLSATVSGKPYELTAETTVPCQVNFVKREDFLRFLKEHSDACFRVAEQLSAKYNSACHQIRDLGLSHSAVEKLAKLLLEWSAKNGKATKAESRLKLAFTHEEIAQMINTSRETVTRLFADLKRRQILQGNGSTLLIRNKGALKALAITQ